MPLPDMSKMVGPLPLGAWVVITAGGLGVAIYTRRQAPAPAYGDELVPSDTSPMPGVGEGPGWVAVPPPTTAPPGAPAPSNNEEWARAAVNYLIAQGYDPAVSDSAVRKYIAGENLGAQEFSLIRVVLGGMGAPPILLPPPMFAPPTMPKITPAPSPTAPAAPAPGPTAPDRDRRRREQTRKRPQPKPDSVRIHVVKPGDTLSKLARRYYNRPDEWRRIYNANRARIGNNPNRIFPGTRLVIPR